MLKVTSISSRARRAVRTNTSTNTIPIPIAIAINGTIHSNTNNTSSRQLFSTSLPLRGGGPLFNLGGLGASREAQYLSKEHGIPRTEYSVNTHLIRSSEVDPFAPGPGATRSAADRAAAHAQPRSELASAGALSGTARIDPTTLDIDEARAKVQASRDRIAEMDGSSRLIKDRGSPPVDSIAINPFSLILASTFIFVLGMGAGKRLSNNPQPASDLAHAQPVVDEVSGATVEPWRSAPVKEQVLADSGLTSLEAQPSTSNMQSASSLLNGFFWAKS